MDTARTIGSDYEMGRVISSALEGDAVTSAMLAGVLELIPLVGSDVERSRVLQNVARRKNASDEIIVIVLRAASRMTASAEAAQILLAVAETHTLSPRARDSYVAAAEKLGTYDRRHVLAVLERRPL